MLFTFPGGSSDNEYAVFLGAWGSCKLKRRRLSRGSSLLCTTGDGNTDGNCKIISAGRGSSTVNSPKAPATSSSLCTHQNLYDITISIIIFISIRKFGVRLVMKGPTITFLIINSYQRWHRCKPQSNGPHSYLSAYMILDMKLWHYILMTTRPSLPWSTFRLKNDIIRHIWLKSVEEQSARQLLSIITQVWC